MKWLVRSLALMVACTTAAAASVPCVPVGGPSGASPSGDSELKGEAPAAHHAGHEGHHDEMASAGGDDVPPCHRVFSLRAPCECGCDGAAPEVAGSSVSPGFGVRASSPDAKRPPLAAVAMAWATTAHPAAPHFDLDPVPI